MRHDSPTDNTAHALALALAKAEAERDALAKELAAERADTETAVYALRDALACDDDEAVREALNYLLG